MNEEKPTTEGTPFNSAVATLMRLDSILMDIKNLILNNEVPQGLKQYRKLRLVKAFYVQSVCLLKDKTKKDALKKEAEKLKPIVKKCMSGGYLKPFYAFSSELEDKLDNFLIDAQEALQAEGLFMPSKEGVKGL